jgi:hypothetical protein
LSACFSSRSEPRIWVTNPTARRGAVLALNRGDEASRRYFVERWRGHSNGISTSVKLPGVAAFTAATTRST